MSEGQFLHVAFNWSGEPKLAELEKVFNNAIDWMRYAPNCWVLWTRRTPTYWYDRVKPLIGPKDQVFICKLDETVRQGWLDEWIWKWFDKHGSS